MAKLLAHRFHMGVDLGQTQNHSAIVVVEQRIESEGEVCPVMFEPVAKRVLVVKHVEQIVLETSYTKVVRRMGEVSRSAELRDVKLTVAFDATGLGRVAADMLREDPPRGELMGVSITGGETGRTKEGLDCVPKTELMMGMQRAFEVEGLCVAPGMAHWELLERELLALRRVASARGVQWVSEEQDDLAMALAVGLHGYRQRLIPTKGEKLRRYVDLVG